MQVKDGAPELLSAAPKSQGMLSDSQLWNMSEEHRFPSYFNFDTVLLYYLKMYSIFRNMKYDLGSYNYCT